MRRNLCIPLLGGLIVLAAAPAESPADRLLAPPRPLPDDLPRLLPLLPEATDAPTRESWETERRALLGKWRDFLGRFPEARSSLEAEVLSVEELSRFTRKRVKYRIEEGVFADGYLLIPRRGSSEPGRGSADTEADAGSATGAPGDGSAGGPPAARLPAVVVFHSTVASQAKEPAGLDPARRELAIGEHLVQRGYVVLCPRCFIFEEGVGYESCVERASALHPSWKGMTRMAFDGSRAADYLVSIPQVDPDRLGCIGHSLGAKEALYAAALDERFKVAVFSEGGIGIGFSNWDAVWYLGPGVRDPGFALDHHQLVALMAPRAFLLLAGDSADGSRSWAFIEAALPVYRLLGADGKLGWLRHGDGHRYSGAARKEAEAFLDRWLKR